MGLARSPLAPLLAAVALVVVAWALVVPPFQAPDEPSHFGYVQSLAENGERPATYPPPGGLALSSEERFGLVFAGTGRPIIDPTTKPAWHPEAERGFDALARTLERDDRADVTAIGLQRGHPPLYYGYETLPYRIGWGSDLFGRLFLMRLWSGVLMLVTTAGAWLLVGELTGRDRLLQLCGAGCVGLQPVATFVSAGVNPDALLFATFSLGLWLGARVLRRGPDRAAVAGLLAVTTLAALSKEAGLALVPATVFALVVAVLRAGVGLRRTALLATAAGGLMALTGFLAERGLADRAGAGGGVGELREFGSYLWQFYLPRLPFQDPVPGLSDLPVWDVWTKGSWGAFGWLEEVFPGPAYVAFAAVTLLAFGGASVAIARGAFAPGWPVLAFFAVAAGGLLLGLHWIEFGSIREEGVASGLGRYVLPLMPIAGTAMAAALTNLRGRRPAAAALVLAGMAALQLAALAVVSGQVYA